MDALAGASNISFNDKRYGFVAEYKYKARTFILLKPTTYMNLSGRAVAFWLQKESIEISNLLVLVDDLALPFGTIRMRAKGSACLLYTSDAADERSSVDLGGRRIIKKKNIDKQT